MFKIKVILKSTMKETMFLYLIYLKKCFSFFNLKYCIFNLPKKKKLFTLNKSPNVNKTSREQFELNSYKTVIFIQVLKSMSMPLKYIFSNLPKTVSLKIQKI